MRSNDPHQIAKACFDVRLAIGAARAVLAEDAAIAHPLPGAMISSTEYWDDALGEGKKRARLLIHAAHGCALELMSKVGNRSKSEAGAQAVEIKEAIEWAIRCLNQHGDAPNNDDRMGASYAIDVAWQLAGILLRIFAIEQSMVVAEIGR